MHGTLATALPTAAFDAAAARELADALADRLDWAVRQAPELASRAPAARAVLTAVRDLDDRPTLQRVHGDLHLGQVLDGGARGWVMVDFEGEPLRPLPERSRPDLALRDVAGMLRSFDYAAGHLRLHDRSPDAAHRSQVWAEACRAGFCAGYAAESGHDPRGSGTLLRALELDKALYEAAYEAGNRPEWLAASPPHRRRRRCPRSARWMKRSSTSSCGEAMATPTPCWACTPSAAV
jgi:1,4-alpha-glucan branching enzyme